MSKLLRGLMAFYLMNMAEDTGGAPVASEPTDDVSSPAQAEESDVQWDMLSDESSRDSGMGDEAPPEIPAAAEVPPEEPAQPQPAAPEEVTSPAPEAQPETPTPEAAEVPQLTPEQQAELTRQWQEYQAKQQQELENFYAIDEESALALATEPEKVLPKLAAQLHMSVMQQVQAQIVQQMPQLLTGVQDRNVRETKAKDEFFSAWPELKGKEQEVLQMGVMFRQLNPKATPQEAVARIGEMTMNALGLKRAASPAQNTPPAAPAPFRPAGGPSAARPTSAPQKSSWDDLLDE